MMFRTFDFKDMMPIGVDHSGCIYERYPLCRCTEILVNMTMNEVAGFILVNEPAEAFEAPMAQILLVMNPSRWGVGDHQIDSPSPPDSGAKAADETPHFILGILIRPSIIPHRSFQTENV